MNFLVDYEAATEFCNKRRNFASGVYNSRRRYEEPIPVLAVARPTIEHVFVENEPIPNANGNESASNDTSADIFDGIDDVAPLSQADNERVENGQTEGERPRIDSENAPVNNNTIVNPNICSGLDDDARTSPNTTAIENDEADTIERLSIGNGLLNNETAESVLGGMPSNNEAISNGETYGDEQLSLFDEEDVKGNAVRIALERFSNDDDDATEQRLLIENALMNRQPDAEPGDIDEIKIEIVEMQIDADQANELEQIFNEDDDGETVNANEKSESVAEEVILIKP